MSASHLTVSPPTPRVPPPDPEVRPAAERRTWTAAEKLRILRAAEACRPGSPERGALAETALGQHFDSTAFHLP
jgi:hypothetical protein